MASTDAAVGSDARTRHDIAVTVNGTPHSATVPARLELAGFLRDRLGLTGTKVSCELQVCGACSVLVDGQPVSACTYLAVDAAGRHVQTVEGLSTGGVLSDLQVAFMEHFALQCGFCTPGFLMMATALLRERPSPSREEVIEYLSGNICRCTGYAPIVDAIMDVARTRAAGGTAARAAGGPTARAAGGTATGAATRPAAVQDSGAAIGGAPGEESG